MTEIYTVGHPPYKSAYLSIVSIHAIKSGKTLCGRRVNLNRWRIIGHNEKSNLVDCKICLRNLKKAQEFFVSEEWIMKIQELVDFGEWGANFGDVWCDIDGCAEVVKKVVCLCSGDDVYHLCKNHGHEYLRETKKKRSQETEGKLTSFIVNRDGLYAAEQQFEETDIP